MELTFLLLVYFIPAIAAAVRRHKDAGAIFVLNMLLGWTFIGWVAALVWASTGNVKDQPKRDLVDGIEAPLPARR